MALKEIKFFDFVSSLTVENLIDKVIEAGDEVFFIAEIRLFGL